MPEWRRPLRHCRGLSTGAVAAVLTPPAVFGGLLVTLWAYKCLMMVIFQNKIIYMPSVPPFARSEKTENYTVQCRPVIWTEHDLGSVDGTALKLLEGRLRSDETMKATRKLAVLYFQGNASSLPPRLPYLSQVIRAVYTSTGSSDDVEVSMVALSYRGYWTSKGSASQAGIELDAEAALEWVLKQYGSDTKVVIWGQSIGTGVATLATASLIQRQPGISSRINGLLLETPFVNMRALLVAMYPQKWLPYRYLAPFLWSTWESEKALRQIGDSGSQIQVMLVQAGDDEIVPDGQASILEQSCRDEGLAVERRVIAGALHQDVMMKPQGRRQIVEFFSRFVQ